MADLASALKDTPLPTIFVVAGIVFWLLAIAGSIAGKITVLPGQQKTAGVVGTLFVVLGMMLYLVPGRSNEQAARAHPNPVTTSAVSITPVAPSPSISILSRGTGTLRGTWHFDLDAGRENTDGDIWWEQRTNLLRAMVPQGGAKILNLGAGDFESISPAQLQKLEYSMVPIPGDDDNSNRLVSGDIFAVLTRSGNHSKVQVLSYGYNLQIQWITYQTIADH